MKLWDVSLAWEEVFISSPTRVETDVQIEVKYAKTAMDAVRVCAEWRKVDLDQVKEIKVYWIDTEER
jgi:hypothetical protein